jgi:Mg-chelatase subunit ChlD
MPFKKLFSSILRINPETQKLQDICRILLERDLDCNASLIDLAFHSDNSNQVLNKPVHKVQTERKGSHEIDETSIGTMVDITEFPKIIKKEFLLPDSVFDRRLTRRELMVTKKQYRETRRSWDQVFQEENNLTPQKVAARQKTYLLMDVSASTEQHHRLMIEKAIAIAYLESNNKHHGEIYFRAFNQDPGPLINCKTPKEYRQLINLHIMTARPLGQTNLQKALDTALEDLALQTIQERAEILVLTDGLSQINVETILSKKIPCKIHIILIGGDQPHLNNRDLRERFNQMHQGHLQQIKESQDPQEQTKIKQQLDDLFERKKEQIKVSVIDELKNNLRQLAQKTEGLFIHIPDLPEALTCHENQAQAITTRVDVIEKLLQNTETTGLEKEQLLDELLALRAYLDELRERSPDALTKEAFKKLQERMGHITISSNELRAMLDHLRVTCRWRSQGGGSHKLGLIDSLRLAYRLFQQLLQRLRTKAK